MVVSMQVKMNEAEREQIKLDAHRHNMNASEYIRWLVQKEREKNESKI